MKRWWKAARLGVAVGAAALAVAAAPRGAGAETLGSALTSAYENSGLLEQNRALLRAADEDVATAVAALRPVINWEANVRRNFGNVGNTTAAGFVESGIGDTEADFGVNLQLLLYDFGESRIAIDIAKETVLATRQALIGVEQNVLLRAVVAYFALQEANETVALRQNNVRLISRELRAAQDRFEVGEVTRTDVSLAEARLARARANLAVAEGDRTEAIEEFRVAVGRAPGALSPPASLPRLPASMEEARALAVRNHPDIKRAQRDVTVAELGVALADAGLRPEVSLNAGLQARETFGERDFGRNGSVSIRTEGPIYQGGRLTALVRQAMAQRDAARAELLVIADQLEQDAANAYARVQSRRAALEASQREVRAAQLAFEGVREEATLGARTTLDVLDSEQDLLDARANVIAANAQLYIAAYQLLASIGVLTAEDLNLPVQRYDPAQYYNLVKDAPAAVSRQGRELDRVLRAIGKE